MGQRAPGRVQAAARPRSLWLTSSPCHTLPPGITPAVSPPPHEDDASLGATPRAVMGASGPHDRFSASFCPPPTPLCASADHPGGPSEKSRLAQKNDLLPTVLVIRPAPVATDSRGCG